MFLWDVYLHEFYRGATTQPTHMWILADVTEWKFVYYDVPFPNLVNNPIIRGVKKFRKETVSFGKSVYPSVRPNGTTRFPLEGFSWNLEFEDFSKICRDISSFINIWQNTWREDACTFIFTSRSVLLKLINVPDKRCTENQNTLLRSVPFPENRAVNEIMWKNEVGPDRPQMAT
jgi:hypothetical protein